MIAAVAASWVLCCGASLAQSDSERIAELERLVRQLSERLKELEQRQGGPVPGSVTNTAQPVAPPPPAPAGEAPAGAEARLQTLERTVTQMTEASNPGRASLGVPLHGFADVGYVHSTQRVSDDGRSGFALGSLDFYLTPQIGPRIKTLLELVFEWDSLGNFSTELERLQLGYTFADQLTVWAGRFHTPYGYWNTAFHHGAQLQTAITRPRFLEFEEEGGVMPAHSVGLWATGRHRAGAGKLVYDAYVANGDRIAGGVLEFNPVGDDNGSKALGGRAGYQFGDARSGLMLGVHGLTQTVGVDVQGALSAQAQVNVLGGYAVYDTDEWEGIAEYYHFRNRDVLGASGTRSSWAAFGQLARRLDSGFTPYLRFEAAQLDQTDPYFVNLTGGGAYKRGVVGLRYDLDPRAALKLEGNRTNDRRLDEMYNEFRVQFAVRF